MRDRLYVRQVGARRDPLPVGLERQSEQIVGDAQISVGAERNRLWRHGLHLLRHHADISGVAAVVDEAIVSEAVAEPSDEHKIVLEPDIGATPAPAAASVSPAMPAMAAAVEAAAMASTVEAAGASASEPACVGAAGEAAGTRASEAGMAAGTRAAGEPARARAAGALGRP